MQLYRSAIRSINMIKSAFIELLKDKNISKITVKEVTELANLTRNTFYAHFNDLYAVNEAVENDVIQKTIEMMDELSGDALFDNTLIFFNNFMKYIEKEKVMFRALLQHGTAASFINKYSNLIIDHVLNNLNSIKVSNKEEFRIFLNVLFSGAVFVIKQYLENESTWDLETAAKNLNDIFVNCYHLYL